MTTTATVVLVVGLGGAAFLFLRSQQQQQAAMGAAAGTTATGGASRPGGIGGLAQGLLQQWKGDPLGIKNAKAVVGVGTSVVRAGANEVSGLVHSIGSSIGGLF